MTSGHSSLPTITRSALYLILGIGAVWYAQSGDWVHALVTILIAFILILPTWLVRRYSLPVPAWFVPVLQVFLVISLFFGSTIGLYQQYWWYDDILHFSWGAGGVVLGFVLIEYLGRHTTKALSLHPFFFALFAFSFAVMTSTLWEIIEFVADITLGFNTQQGGWPDTMIDLVLGALGTTLVSAWSYRWLRTYHQLPFTETPSH